MARTCDGCGYDLRATPGDVCPECGRRFDPSRPQHGTPWLREIGRIRAFWQTARVATAQPASIASDIDSPADGRRAKQFRRWLAAWISLWPIAAMAWLYVDFVTPSPTIRGPPPVRWYGPPRWTDRWLNDWPHYLEAAGVALVAAAVYVWVLLSLGVTSYFAHPSDLEPQPQERAIALSYYAAGPLAWLPLAWVVSLGIDHAIGAAGWWTVLGNGGHTWLIRSSLWLAPMSAVVYGWLRAVFVVVRDTTGDRPRRASLAAIVSLLAWPVLFALFPLATFAAVVLGEIVLWSGL